jgi:hypothetical protein
MKSMVMFPEGDVTVVVCFPVLPQAMRRRVARRRAGVFIMQSYPPSGLCGSVVDRRPN